MKALRMLLLSCRIKKYLKIVIIRPGYSFIRPGFLFIRPGYSFIRPGYSSPKPKQLFEAQLNILKDKDQMMQEPICIDDVKKCATDNLPKYATDYFNSGADDEFSMKENCRAYRRLRIRPSVLKGIADVDPSSTVLGYPVPFPICISPTACHKLAHPDGEIATVKAAMEHGVGMAVSMWSTTRMKEIASVADGHFLMMQLQLLKDKNITLSLVNAAEKHGFRALVITVDQPVSSIKRNEYRNRMSGRVPSHTSFKQESLLVDILPPGPETAEMRTPLRDLFVLFNNATSWADIDWLQGHTKLPILLKGILNGEDAAEAVKHGIKGIIVSNHGGRQLDGVPATIEALPEVVKAVHGSCEVFVDGGIRTGTDVFKALALGAKAVFIGRPIIWGLAYKGEEGVKKVLQILRDELRRAMMLAGCASLKDIKRSMVVHESYYRRLLSDVDVTE